MSSWNWARVLVAVVIASGVAVGQSTTRVSVASSGAQANNGSSPGAVSADGRYVAFESGATNLVALDTNGVVDVFVHDRLTGQTTRVSVSSAGVQGNGSSQRPSIAADGRCVAFESNATQLVSGDTNGQTDVFVHDRQTGVTTRVSVASTGAQSGSPAMLWSSSAISGDGRFVGFYSWGGDLVPGDTNGKGDVFLHDRQTAQTTRASVSSSGAQGDDGSYSFSISADGRYVAFQSSANNFGGGGYNSIDIFVRDRTLGLTSCVSLTWNGQATSSSSQEPSISPDGRYVAFVNWGTLVPWDSNGASDVYVRDRALGRTLRASVAFDGSESNADSFSPSITMGGRVAFRSEASNLVIGDTNGAGDVFVRDIATYRTELASAATGGAHGNGISGAPGISADGAFVVFYSASDNLVPGDTNGQSDVFVSELGWGPSAPVTYCTSGTSLGGCVPLIGGTGEPSVSSSSGFVIAVGGVDGERSGAIFYGAGGQIAVPWGIAGSSWLCVREPLQRTGALVSGGTAGLCDGWLSVDWNQFRAGNPGAIGSPFAAGVTLDAQGWFRDPGSPKNSGLSNGLHFTLFD